MLELAERILRLTGSRSRLRHLPLPKDDPRRRCPDITLARSELGWQPTVDLDEGLRRTIACFKRRRDPQAALQIPSSSAPIVATTTA